MGFDRRHPDPGLPHRRRLTACLGVALLVWAPAPVLAAAKKGVRFLNRTGVTLTEVALSPTGTVDYGPNQCANDKGGSVGADQELQVRGVPPGRYDIRMTDVHGRLCFARNIDVQNGAAFSVGEQNLVDCAR